jgi:hypothetical protein
MFYCERCKTSDPDRCVCRERERLRVETANLNAEVEAIRDQLAEVRDRVTNLDAFADGRLSLVVDAVAGSLSCAIVALHHPNWDA